MAAVKRVMPALRGGGGIGPGLARLAYWIEQTERGYGEGAVADWWSGDCVSLAWAAYIARFGRAGNRSAGDDMMGTWSLQSLSELLNAWWVLAGDPQTLVEALIARPGSMMLVSVGPPNKPGHVYWLVADDRPGTLTLRWVDPQRPGLFKLPAWVAGPRADWWGRQLPLPNTRVALFDAQGRPIDPIGLGLKPGGAGVAALLDPPSTTRPACNTGRHATNTTGTHDVRPERDMDEVFDLRGFKMKWLKDSTVGKYVDPSGKLWYVKKEPTEDHVKNAVAASALMRAFGFNCPQVRRGRNAPGLDGEDSECHPVCAG